MALVAVQCGVGRGMDTACPLMLVIFMGGLGLVASSQHLACRRSVCRRTLAGMDADARALRQAYHPRARSKLKHADSRPRTTRGVFAVVLLLQKNVEMDMTPKATVQALNINDLKRYSAEARVNQPLISSSDLVTRMNCYEPGQVTPMHIHPDDDEVVFCVEGRGAITFEDRDDVPISAGSLVSLPAGLTHGIKAAQDSRMVVIYTTNAGYTSVRPSHSPDAVI